MRMSERSYRPLRLVRKSLVRYEVSDARGLTATVLTCRLQRRQNPPSSHSLAHQLLSLHLREVALHNPWFDHSARSRPSVDEALIPYDQASNPLHEPRTVLLLGNHRLALSTQAWMRQAPPKRGHLASYSPSMPRRTSRAYDLCLGWVSKAGDPWPRCVERPFLVPSHSDSQCALGIALHFAPAAMCGVSSGNGGSRYAGVSCEWMPALRRKASRRRAGSWDRLDVAPWPDYHGKATG